jgi:Xaa-Pro aminopeptidase
MSDNTQQLSLQLAQKLTALRAAIKAEGLNGYIIPRADEYQGEFVAPYAERLQYLTGFTGSAGIAIVLEGCAGVLSDARYSLQILKEVPADLYETGDTGEIAPSSWLSRHVNDDAVIGFDPWLHTADQIDRFRNALTLKSARVQAVDKNLIDDIWQDQPAEPGTKVTIVPDDAAGKTTAEKLEMIQKTLQDKQVGAFILSLPDSIAWLLNIRASDVAYTPLALSYAIVHADQPRIDWIIDPARVGKDVLQHISRGVQIEVRPRTELETHLDALVKNTRKTIGIDDKRTPLWFRIYLEGAGARLENIQDPCINPKAEKNAAEVKAIKQAHIHDGIALVKFLHWLERESASGALTEIDIADRLESFRRENASFKGLSFPTICGWAGHGAIVHYRATTQSNATVKPPGILLLDSGAQYEFGTTDITRTIAIGKPDPEVIESYTHVLKGHVAVAAAQFPEGTTGAQIDALARQPLWQAGLDFAHGTGHGVGFYLGVHEEAANLSPRGHNAIKAGMLLSNEPGYYKADSYGIRIENLVLAKKMGMLKSGKTMLGFETVSFAPFDRQLIKPGLLTPREREWVDQYHHGVFMVLKDHLAPPLQDWLKDKTKPL